jgi:hypothetical protein
LSFLGALVRQRRLLWKISIGCARLLGYSSVRFVT